jgi:hypothetical protein
MADGRERGGYATRIVVVVGGREGGKERTDLNEGREEEKEAQNLRRGGWNGIWRLDRRRSNTKRGLYPFTLALIRLIAITCPCFL